MSQDAISSLILPKPPGLREFSTIQDANIVVNEIISHMNQLAFYNQQLHAELDDLLEGATISSLSVDKLTGGTILVDEIFIGSEQFELDGVLKQLRIYDDQATPRLRVEIGRFGAGAAAGIKCYDASGNVIFQVGSTNELDGVFIKDLTVSTAKIGNLQVTTAKIGNDAVNENKRIDVYTASDTHNFPSIASPGIGAHSFPVTHNFGRKVTAIGHTQNFSFAAGVFGFVHISASTTSSFIATLIVVNLSGGAYDPGPITSEVNYW
jgi:hypothetical protein